MCNFKKLIVLFALLSVANGASAVTENLGSFDGSNTITTKHFTFSPGQNLALLPGAVVDAKVMFDIFFSGTETEATTSAGAISLELKDINGNQLLGVDDVAASLSGGSLAGPVAFDTTATSAGVALTYTGLLGAGNYMISFGGTVPASYTGGGAIVGSVSVAAVPIPAAVWLFGSAIVGLFGIRRREEKALMVA